MLSVIKVAGEKSRTSKQNDYVHVVNHKDW